MPYWFYIIQFLFSFLAMQNMYTGQLAGKRMAWSEPKPLRPWKQMSNLRKICTNIWITYHRLQKYAECQHPFCIYCNQVLNKCTNYSKCRKGTSNAWEQSSSIEVNMADNYWLVGKVFPICRTVAHQKCLGIWSSNARANNWPRSMMFKTTISI